MRSKEKKTTCSNFEKVECVDWLPSVLFCSVLLFFYFPKRPRALDIVLMSLTFIVLCRIFCLLNHCFPVLSFWAAFILEQLHVRGAQGLEVSLLTSIAYPFMRV